MADTQLIGSPADAGLPIGELVDGFDEIAGQAIPYARLPRRATTAFASRFTHWGDLAGETTRSLATYPQGGERTIRALVSAAHEAVTAARTAGDIDTATAVGQLLDRLSARDRVLLNTRIWALQPQTQTAVAEQLQVHQASVRRNEPKAEARFRELLTDPGYTTVSEAAAQLAQRLGSVTSEDIAATELSQLGFDLHNEKGLALLAAAGPYRPRGGWLENTSTGGARQATTTVEAMLARRGAPTTSELVIALKRVGMAADAAQLYLQNYPDLRCVGARWVRWGESVADQIEASLHLRGAPVPVDEIVTAVGRAVPERTVRETLYADGRFVRVSLRNWALRRWGLRPYTGIFDAVCERIDAAAGKKISVNTVVEQVQDAFPDVKETSIRTYVQRAPAFVVEKGMVPRRKKSDKPPRIPPLSTAPGAFRNGDDEIRLAINVDRDVLRGSGRTLPAAVAAELGVVPGQRKTFHTEHGPVSVIWRISATTGPTFSSLRTPAMAVGAKLGDTLVLIFGIKAKSLTAARVGVDTSSQERLGVLLGRDARDPLPTLAEALDCAPEDVEPLLRKRDELHLLAPEPVTA